MLPVHTLPAIGNLQNTPWECVENGCERQRARLYQSRLVTLGYTHCCPHSDAVGPEFALKSNLIAFPRRGAFVMHYRGERCLIDTTRAVYHNPNDPFRTSHPGGVGDDCTWMSVASTLLSDALRTYDPAASEHEDHPFSFFHGPCGQRAFLLHRLAYQHLYGRPAPDPVLIEETVTQILDDVIRAAYSMIGARPVHARAGTVKAHAELTEATKLILLVRFRERLTIGTIAGLVHSSPFNLCRIFRAHSGMAIHEYLTQLRLRAAVDLLLDSKMPLSDLALSVGFASHSHLCDAFRREFGTTPSEARRCLAAGQKLPVMSAPASA
jgi:AraC-like DNA-binding protein